MAAAQLPLRVAELRTDPVRVGTWSQTVAELQTMQRAFARQNDVFKLAQSVFLQAYGGFGLDALRVFLTDVCVQDIGLAAPEVGVAVVMCYEKWSHTPLTPETTPQFLTDLYHTCEWVCRAPKSQWLLSLVATLQAAHVTHYATSAALIQDVTDGKNLRQVMETVVHWWSQDPPKLVPLLEHLNTAYPDHDHLAGYLTWCYVMERRCGHNRALYVLTLALHELRIGPSDVRQRPVLEVTEQLDVPALWTQLFPAHLALPVCSWPERTLAESLDRLHVQDYGLAEQNSALAGQHPALAPPAAMDAEE